MRLEMDATTGTNPEQWWCCLTLKTSNGPSDAMHKPPSPADSKSNDTFGADSIRIQRLVPGKCGKRWLVEFFESDKTRSDVSHKKQFVSDYTIDVSNLHFLYQSVSIVNSLVHSNRADLLFEMVKNPVSRRLFIDGIYLISGYVKCVVEVPDSRWLARAINRDNASVLPHNLSRKCESVKVKEFQERCKFKLFRRENGYEHVGQKSQVCPH
ncbi:hypothetical protein Tco_1384158 [Tanacetum coccineum]